VTLPNGAYAPALDKLDQGIDLIKEAVVNTGFQYNVDVAILIDVGADMLYDEVRGEEGSGMTDFINFGPLGKSQV
jgi:enolase